MRTYEDCFSSFNKYILSNFNTDIFISTWSTSNFSVKEGFNYKDTNNITFEKLKDIYKPLAINIFQKPKDISKSYLNVNIPKILIKKEPIHYSGAIPFSYLTYQTNLLLNHHIQIKNEKYHAIIHMRPDLSFFSNIPEYVFDKMDYLWTLTSPFDYRVSDRFSISNFNNYNTYTSLWKNLNIYWKNPLGNKKYLFFYNKKNHLVGERLMNYHIKKFNNIKLQQLPKICDILRHK